MLIDLSPFIRIRAIPDGLVERVRHIRRGVYDKERREAILVLG